MAERFFANRLIEGERVSLEGPEAHHLLHVMRAKPGTEVILFDGSGGEFSARVETIGRTEVELALLQRREIDRELPFALTLGVSLPKGDRQKWLVEKAVELGLSRLVPLVTARSVAQPVDKVLERLRRGVVEASKQCGRNRLMEIGDPESWKDFVHRPPPDSRRWLAHPGADHPLWQVASEASPPEENIHLAVGPEGGLTDDEVAEATAAGWQAVSLGPRILRVETAALLMVGLAVPVADALRGRHFSCMS